MGLRRFKKYAIGAGGMLVLVVAVVLATGSGSAVAAQISNVFVTNDASHPVPVHEQGTATVQQAGTPVSIHLQDGHGSTTPYIVPAGKRLVIQYVNGVLEPSFEPDNDIQLNVGGVGTFEFRGEPETDTSLILISQAVTIYADPGASIQIHTAIDDEDPGSLILEGYLVNA